MKIEGVVGIQHLSWHNHRRQSTETLDRLVGGGQREVLRGDCGVHGGKLVGHLGGLIGARPQMGELGASGKGVHDGP